VARIERAVRILEDDLDLRQGGMEIVQKSVSTGYVRQNMPAFTVFSGGARANGAAGSITTSETVSYRADGTSGMGSSVQVGMTVSASTSTATGPDKASRRAEARMKGYEGDNCGECGNFTLVRNGTCLKCDTCGSTTGCS
jgi:ribonucleoside-diphosphate reductase alpha chain